MHRSLCPTPHCRSTASIYSPPRLHESTRVRMKENSFTVARALGACVSKWVIFILLSALFLCNVACQDRDHSLNDTAVVVENDTAVNITNASEEDIAVVEGGTEKMVNGWTSLRVVVSTNDLDNPKRCCTLSGQERPDFMGGVAPCGEQDVLTTEKRLTLTEYTIPGAIRLHYERLGVSMRMDNIIVPDFLSAVCSSFTVPESHRSVGVSGADVILYVAAGPTGRADYAHTRVCALLPSGRPAVGVINFSPSAISRSRSSLRAAAHEIAHILGFNNEVMRRLKMISTKVHRGKNSTFVITPKVVEVARKYYACKNMDGMQLEDGGNDDVRDSHWKRLFVKDDLMAAVVGASYYSALTLAFFHDTGFYRVKWAMAERMRWGNGTGCGLMNGKCMKNNITMFLDMFCNESVSTKLHCTYERQAIGRCALNTYGAPLDPDKQYFTRSWIGGNQDNLMDYCPIVEPYKDSYCEDGRQQLLPGSRVGPNSRCVKGDRLVAFSREVGDVCAEVYCGRDAVSIRYSGDDSWHVCPEGEYITPTKTFSSGRIICPKREEVCYNTDMSPPFDPHASVALLFLLTSSRRII